MGAILKTGRVSVGKQQMRKWLERMSENDAMSRRSDEDMYRGDFGSSQVASSHQTFTGKSPSAIDKNYEAFEEKTNFKKYTIDYAVIGQLGYIAYKAKVTFQGQTPRGELRVNGKVFRNVTALKEALKDVHTAKRLYGQKIFRKDGWQAEGVIGAETHIYKSQPKALPKKYQWMDEFVEMAYGGYNPY